MIYIDSPRSYPRKRKRYFHMVGPKEELHAFASELGLKRSRFEYSNSGIPHYDVPEEYYQLAVISGATQLKRTELLKKGKEYGRLHNKTSRRRKVPKA